MAETSGLPPVRIGTRRSNLAVVQAEGVRAGLQAIAPDRTFEIDAIRVLGDKDTETALYAFGAKSLWTSDLEKKLVTGQLDVVVHCLKDMPTALPDSCELAVIPLRDSPRDALIVKAGLPYTSLDSLPQGAVVGTSSVRRSAQLKRLHPHLKFANIRGNVETRLAKLDDPNGEFTCMIMSACGFERIGLSHRLTQYLSSKNGGIYHAVGQGALALEIRKGDAQTLGLIQPLADRSSTLVCLAERELMRRLEGGCSVPIGVESDWLDEAGHVLNLRAIVVSLDGLQAVEESLSERVSEVDEAVALGQKLAAKLVEAGAGKILDKINANRPAKT